MDIVTAIITYRRTGIKITLGFFEDILVPEYALQDPSFFDDSEKLWVWKFDGNDMYMDLQEEVRFRVHSVKFNSIPTPAQLQAMQGKQHLPYQASCSGAATASSPAAQLASGDRPALLCALMFPRCLLQGMTS